MTEEFHFLSQVPVDWLTRLLIAALCGGIIGLERELKRKAAGIRTNAMICFGACLYMLTAELSFVHFSGMANSDPLRIIGQIVVGMGFIGAGTIIQSRGHITGLTSAAAMWVVAAVGVVVGVGYPIAGFIVTAIVVAILALIGRVEALVLGKCRLNTTRISFRDLPDTWDSIDYVCHLYGKNRTAFPVIRTLVQTSMICFMDVSYCNIHPDHRAFLTDLLEIEDIRLAGKRGIAALEG